MPDSDIACTAIIVSALVALKAPLLATLAQGWVGKTTEAERRRRAHDSWLREKRTEIYVELISEVKAIVRDDRLLCHLRLHPGKTLEADTGADLTPLERTALDARVRALASASVRMRSRRY